MPTCRIISLGCSRNLVDSEAIAGSLKRSGYRLTENPAADLCIINTCSFIREAREESVDAILEAGRLKRQGKIRILAVCGCLPQYAGSGLGAELPEADIILGTSDLPKLGRILAGRAKRQEIAVSSRLDYLYDGVAPREHFTPRHYAYVKISEGCSNDCSYCIISRLRGRARSRSVPSVLREAKRLARGGRLKEIVLVAQDAAQFGIDRTGKRELPRLVRGLAAQKTSVEWIRLLYTHPAHVTDELIAAVAGEPKVCKYLDLPVQHASDRILRLMNRGITRARMTALIEKLRRRVPGIVLRTSIIVGFPGETERDFAELMRFVKDVRFDRLGAFRYSREEGTPAARMKAQVPERVKDVRLDELLKAQQAISLEANRRLVGRTMRVLVDEAVRAAPGTYTGRTEGDAPDVDGAVYVSGAGIRPGSFCNVRITGAMEYDLMGERVS